MSYQVHLEIVRAPMWDPDEPPAKYPSSEDELISLLWDEVKELPGVIRLVHSDFGSLEIGLGGEWSFVESFPTQDAPSLTALAPHVRADDCEMFTLDGHGEVYSPCNLLDPGDAIEIAKHFIRSGTLAPWVEWGPRQR